MDGLHFGLPCGRYSEAVDKPALRDQAASDAVAASLPPAAPVAFPVAEAADDGRGWPATWLGRWGSSPS